MAPSNAVATPMSPRVSFVDQYALWLRVHRGDNRLYTLHELGSALSVQAMPTAPNAISSTISSVSIIPANPPPGAVWAAAEILVSPSSARFGRYIYLEPQYRRADVHRGFLRDLRERLDQIRGMQFGGEDDEYLIAGGVAGTAGVVIYQRGDGGAESD
ncbi:hypothetical protein DFH08DRAFT_1086340 [Mycena albidolilacea]|uniref:Uncharacterized protein n=1 Tax=Mycena albidolilacea TaxID=1033008 RepID=A0AAD7EGI1_9AGAR|nr:hypothetical protein DFH08DRAFT_1086340 [Mycena albidolilacea]